MHDPRALLALFEQAEAELAATAHPDPYIRKCLGKLHGHFTGS